MSDLPGPVVDIVVAAEDSHRTDLVGSAASAALRSLASQLELPIAPAAVSVRAGDGPTVAVNGEWCAVPGRQHLMRHTASVTDQIVQTLHLHVDHLVTPEVAAAVWAGATGGAGAPPPWFPGLVRDLVRNRVRVGRLGPLLSAGSATATPQSLFEAALTAAGRPVRIVVDPRTAPADPAADGSWRELLLYMATGLHDELGLAFAVPDLAVDPDLPDHHFAVEIGDVRTPLLNGVRPDELLVNDTAERLMLLGVTAQAVTNPATGLPAALASASDAAQLEAVGHTTWTMSGYVVLAVAEVVRRHAAVLARSEIVRYQLDGVESDVPVARPMIAAVGPDVLVRVFRRLLHEGVPVTGLIDVVSALHRAGPPAPADPARVAFPLEPRRAAVVVPEGADDELVATLTQTARIALFRRITRKYASGTTLVAYLVEPGIENRLRDPAPLSTPERQALLAALATEVDLLPPTAQRPVVLTRAAVRARLREVIEIAQPKIAVVAYEELVADINIQPVARLVRP